MKKSTKWIVFIPVSFILLLSGALIIGFIIISDIANTLPPNNPDNYLIRSNRPTDQKILILIGDSITHGTVSFNYAEVLAQRLSEKGIDVINAGINGDLTYNVLQRLQNILLLDPDYITLLIGTNDATGIFFPEVGERQIEEKNLPEFPTLENFKQNYLAIINTLQEKTQAHIALLSIPPIGENTDSEVFQHSIEISRMIQNIALERDLTYIPLNEAMVELLIQANQTPAISTEDYSIDLITYIAVFYNYILGYSYDEISKDVFNQILLCDFLHLNSKGGLIVAGYIETFINGIWEDSN